MKKPLVLSLVTAALLTSNLDALSMFERFEAMEKEMNALKKQVAELKSQKTSKKVDDDEEEEADEVASADDEEDDGEEEEVASNEDTDEEVKSASALAAGEDEDGEEGYSEDDEEDDEDEIATEEERIEELEEAVAELTRNTSGSHLKFTVDYRFAIENMQYDMADGSKQENDSFMTNRLWINMGYKATNNLTFKGQLAYNKAFGARSGASTNNSYETFDWIANENAYDDSIRVRSAYFLWQDQEFLGLDIPWTFSIGRRPSTGGHLANYRDDDAPNSPLAHSINVEFDGLSSKFTVYKPWGTYFKLCAGRGMSNAAPRFAAAPYSEDDNNDNTSIDLAGMIFVPYDDHQYKISTQYYYAANLIDMADIHAADQSRGFATVGDMHSFTANLTIHGIGNEWSDFLDDTIFFVSGAWSKTEPDNEYTAYNAGTPFRTKGMLGSEDSETGHSYWIGTQFPSFFTEDGRWGVEYNHGSKYWRAITYGEDTNIGSKVAARGDAYEAYMTEYLVEDILSLQLRYTFIDYDYTGSNGFFGNSSGNAMSIDDAVAAGNGANVVDEAQDIRLYLRYRY